MEKRGNLELESSPGLINCDSRKKAKVTFTDNFENNGNIFNTTQLNGDLHKRLDVNELFFDDDIDMDILAVIYSLIKFYFVLILNIFPENAQ